MDGKVFQTNEILFNEWKIVKLNGVTHYNLAPTVFGAFGVVISMSYKLQTYALTFKTLNFTNIDIHPFFNIFF
jgi:hypothetical protein